MRTKRTWPLLLLAALVGTTRGSATEPELSLEEASVFGVLAH